ncbi:MAG: hypothetical protein FWB99_02605 [Treponema sp.]|nr:hypothetical protein [Treponema sp.]
MNEQSTQLAKPSPKNKVQLQALLGQEVFSGPLPSPGMLKGYREISPDYPERLMKMAEAHAAADIHKKYKEPFNITFGQVLRSLWAFLFGLSKRPFGSNGLEAVAIAAALGGIAPIIVAALGNLRK